MEFYNSEKNQFFKKMSKDFNFKTFSRLIWIRISIELLLIDWCHRKRTLLYLNFEGFFRCLKTFFFYLGKVSFMGFMVVLKLSDKHLTHGCYPRQNICPAKKTTSLFFFGIFWFIPGLTANIHHTAPRKTGPLSICHICCHIY